MSNSTAPERTSNEAMKTLLGAVSGATIRLTQQKKEEAAREAEKALEEAEEEEERVVLLAIDEAFVAELHEADWERGHFWENGLKALVPKLGFLFEPAKADG